MKSGSYYELSSTKGQLEAQKLKPSCIFASTPHIACKVDFKRVEKHVGGCWESITRGMRSLELRSLPEATVMTMSLSRRETGRPPDE